MSKKIIYLLLALVLPGLVFLFLKFFGKNQFDIPVYYEKGVSNLPTRCQTIKKEQYFLPDSVLKTIKWRRGNALLLSGVTGAEQNELRRLSKEVNRRDLQLIFLDSIKEDRLRLWKNCVLFLNEPYKALLIDNQRRIRGYYALNSRDEIERLEIELEIFLKRY
jgi:hypothetical protein